jgi:hypothetical protein
MKKGAQPSDIVGSALEGPQRRREIRSMSNLNGIDEGRAARGESIARESKAVDRRLDPEGARAIGALGCEPRWDHGHERRTEGAQQHTRVAHWKDESIAIDFRRRNIDQPCARIVRSRALYRHRSGPGIERPARSEP